MTQEIQVVEVGHAQEGGLTTPGDDVVQALGLVSSSAQIRTPELHGVLLMLPTGKYNQAVCAALVQNLTFYDDKRLLAYQGRYPDTSVRFTYIYDGRSEQELKSIERPPHFSRPDCPEIVSNFDFDLSYYLTGLLNLRRGDGPWLIAVDPPNKAAAILDLNRYGPDRLSHAIDVWTEILQDRKRWRRDTRSLEERIADLIFKNEPIRWVRLPAGFLE